LSYYERSPSIPGQPPDNVDFVVMCENGLSGLSDVPLNTGIPEMILNIEKTPTWSKLATLSDPNGKLVLIYKKSAL
jgi:hypothetical protein